MKGTRSGTRSRQVWTLARAEIAALPSIIYVTLLAYLFPLFMYGVDVDSMRTDPMSSNVLAGVGFLLLYPAVGSFLLLNLWREQAIRERRRHLHLTLPIGRRQLDLGYFGVLVLAFLPNALVVFLAWVAFGHGQSSLNLGFFANLLGVEWLLLTLYLRGYTLWKKKDAKGFSMAGLVITVLVVFFLFTLNSGTLQLAMLTASPWLAAATLPLGLWIGWRAASSMPDIS